MTLHLALLSSEVSVGSFIQDIKLPLDGILSPSGFFNCTTEHGVTSKLAEGLLNLALCVVEKKYCVILVLVHTLEGHSLLLVSTWTLCHEL